MAEYIEREAALIEIGDADDTCEAERRVWAIPAADVAPVRHGRWIVDDFTGLAKCSECDNDAPLETTGGEQWCSPFCPLCGTNMKDGDGEET